MGPVPMLAQQVPALDDPLGYGLAGVMLAVAIRLSWVLIADLRAQRDRLQEALDVQREATVAALEAVKDLKDLGRLMRRVLEALPQADDVADTPPPRPRPPTGRRR